MSQIEKLYALLSDGKPHSTREIVKVVYDMDMTSIARIGARVYDLKRIYNAKIQSRPDRLNRKIWWYQLSHAKNPVCGGAPVVSSQKPTEKTTYGELFELKIDQHGEIV